MSTTTNYTTGGAVRKVDLYVMGAFNFNNTTQQATSPSISVESGGQVCAGLVKLAQKVVFTMLSFDVFYDFDWGSQLPPIVLSGNMALLKRVMGSLMADTINKVTNQINSNEDPTMPADEKLYSISYDSFSVDRTTGTVSVTLILRSQSNEVIPIVVPIPAVP